MCHHRQPASRVSHHTSLCPDDMHSPLPLLSTTGLAHCSAVCWHGGAQYQFYVHRPHRLEATTEVTTESPRWSHKHPAGFCYEKKTRHTAFLVATHLQKFMELRVFCVTIQGELSVSTIGRMTEVIVEVLPLQNDRISP